MNPTIINKYIIHFEISTFAVFNLKKKQNHKKVVIYQFCNVHLNLVVTVKPVLSGPHGRQALSIKQMSTSFGP